MLPWETIAERLREELAGYGGLLSLFEEQQRQLINRNAERVLQLSGDIELAVHELQIARRRREQIITACATAVGEQPNSTLRSLLVHMPEVARPLLEALIDEVNVLIHRVRRATRHNHALLVHAVESRQELLRRLRPDSFTQTYSQRGRRSVQSTLSPRPALQAAG